MPDSVDAVVQLSFAIQGVLGRHAAAHELSITQLRLLAILRDREPAMLELARQLELEQVERERADRPGRAARARRPDRRAGRRARRARHPHPEGRRLTQLVEGQVVEELESVAGAA